MEVQNIDITVQDYCYSTCTHNSTVVYIHKCESLKSTKNLYKVKRNLKHLHTIVISITHIHNSTVIYAHSTRTHKLSWFLTMTAK